MTRSVKSRRRSAARAVRQRLMAPTSESSSSRRPSPRRATDGTSRSRCGWLVTPRRSPRARGRHRTEAGRRPAARPAAPSTAARIAARSSTPRASASGSSSECEPRGAEGRPVSPSRVTDIPAEPPTRAIATRTAIRRSQAPNGPSPRIGRQSLVCLGERVLGRVLRLDRIAEDPAAHARSPDRTRARRARGRPHGLRRGRRRRPGGRLRSVRSRLVSIETSRWRVVGIAQHHRRWPTASGHPQGRSGRRTGDGPGDRLGAVSRRHRRSAVVAILVVAAVIVVARRRARPWWSPSSSGPCCPRPGRCRPRPRPRSAWLRGLRDLDVLLGLGRLLRLGGLGRLGWLGRRRSASNWSSISGRRRRPRRTRRPADRSRPSGRR